MHDNGTTKTQQSEFYTSNLEQHRAGLVNDMQVVHLVLGGSELFQDSNIFASTPDCVDRDIELHFSTEQQWKFGKRKIAGWESGLDRTVAALLDCLLDRFGN
jgi:hypothetical protein